MYDESQKGIAFRVTAAVVFVVLAILPKVIAAFIAGDGVLSILLAIVITLGLLFLRWLALTLALIFLNALSSWLIRVYTYKVFKSDEIKNEAVTHVYETSIALAFVLIVGYTLLLNWGLVNGTLMTVFNFCFPKVG